MSELIEKLRLSRKISVSIDGKTFTGVRATAEQVSEYVGNREFDAQICRNHITGWSGVTEADLIEGGSSKSVEFDKALFDEVISDKPEWWDKIVPEVIREAMDRANKRTDSQKKSKSG